MRKLAAGEVKGVDPVEVPAATVYYIAAAERDRRQARIDNELAKTPEGKLVVAHRRAVALAEREIRRLEREGKKGGVDPIRLQRLSNTLANLIRVQPSAPATEAPEPPEHKQVSGTLEERLAQAVEAEEAARREQEEAHAEDVEVSQPEPVAPPKKPSLTDLRLDTSPKGQRAYEARLRELGFKDEAIRIMLSTNVSRRDLSDHRI